MDGQELEAAVARISAEVPDFGEDRIRRALEATDEDLVFECQGMPPGPFEPPAPAAS